MTTERTFQGAWRLTTVDATGHLFTRQFMGYSKREAQRLFREELRAADAPVTAARKAYR